MKGLFKVTVLILAIGLVGIAEWAMAGNSIVRMIPMGSVSLLADGKEVRQFKSEAPLPDGLLMVSQGNCVVQSSGLQLVAHDKSVFALAEGAGQWNLTIKEGRVDFSMRADAKPITFQTPHDVIEAKQSVVKASTDSLIRGFVVVTPEETQLGVLEGTLQISGTAGTTIIEEGKGIRLAIATPPGSQSEAAGAGAGSAGTGTGAGLGAGAGAAGVGAGLGGTGVTMTAIGVGVGVTAIGVTAGVVASQEGGEDGSPQ